MQFVGPGGKSSVHSRSRAPLPQKPSRKRSYSTPQAGGRRLHLAGPSLACAVLVASTLADEWRSNHGQIMRSRESQSLWLGPVRYRISPDLQHIRIFLRRHLVCILLTERRAQPPARMGTLLVRVCGADAGRAAAICSESSFRRRPAYWVTSVWGTWKQRLNGSAPNGSS